LDFVEIGAVALSRGGVLEGVVLAELVRDAAAAAVVRVRVGVVFVVVTDGVFGVAAVVVAAPAVAVGPVASSRRKRSSSSLVKDRFVTFAIRTNIPQLRGQEK
jgi:hypothetical protein